jgi:hypothetical protein
MTGGEFHLLEKVAEKGARHGIARESCHEKVARHGVAEEKLGAKRAAACAVGCGCG